MGTTQYVGARYVPLFSEPAQWDINKQYEPLTIVINHGNSYTSRQFVPVGIELTNEAFWALTGNYNAQVEQYRQEVRTYDDRITTAQTTADGAAKAATEADTKATNANAAIAAEVTRATAKEAEIQSLAETNETDIAHLDAQMAATTGSELLNRITTEVTNREAADTVLGARIDTEKNERVAGDDATKALVTAETERATKAEKANADSIAALKESLGSSTGNEFVVIGDSVSAGVGTTTPSTDTWCVKFAAANNLTLHNYAESNAGFKAGGSGSNKANFQRQAQIAVDDTSFVNDDVALVVIMGGCNDSVGDNDIASYVAGTVNTCVTGFKNAKIYVIPYFWGANPVSRQTGYKFNETMSNFNDGMRDVNRTNNVRVILHAWEWMCGRSSYMHDFIHPNTSGAAYLAKTIQGAIVSGTDMRPNFSYKLDGFTCNCTDGIITFLGNYTLKATVTAYKPIITLPEWASFSSTNFAVAGFNGSWSNMVMYYDANSHTISSPGDVQANTQLYFNCNTFSANV